MISKLETIKSKIKNIFDECSEKSISSNRMPSKLTQYKHLHFTKHELTQFTDNEFKGLCYIVKHNINYPKCVGCNKEITELKNFNAGFLATCKKQECINKKRQNTCLELFGETSFSKTDNYKTQFTETCLEKYGVTNPMKSIDVQKKAEKTCLLNHGVSSPMKSIDIQNKAEKTCLEKYGVTNPQQNKEIQLKTKETFKNNSLLFIMFFKIY